MSVTEKYVVVIDSAFGYAVKVLNGQDETRAFLEKQGIDVLGMFIKGWNKNLFGEKVVKVVDHDIDTKFIITLLPEGA